MKDITSYVLIALAMMAFLFPACVQGATTLAAGRHHVVQIDKDMVFWAWGGNEQGQLSLGHNSNQPTPAPVTLAPTFGDPVSVCAGHRFTCVLESNKKVACSGIDTDGQIGEGATASSTNTFGLAPGVTDIAHLACANDGVLATTTSGELLVWGKDAEGQLGTGNATPRVFEAVVRFCC
jgi:alpha-tubulin suppressor-like RCC1 family protein